jgi:hypothetical protein
MIRKGFDVAKKPCLFARLWAENLTQNTSREFACSSPLTRTDPLLVIGK